MRIKKNDGFTLIELMVVIAVLGILSAIVIPRITGITGQAKQSALKSTASSLQSNLEIAMAEDTLETIDGTVDGWFTWGDSSVSMNQPDNITISSVSISKNDYTVTLEHSGLGADADFTKVTISKSGGVATGTSS